MTYWQQHSLFTGVAGNFFFNLFLIGGQLLYNVMLVSAIYQYQSAICIHVSAPSWTSFPPPIPLGCHRAQGLSSLCHTTNSYWLSILHMVMYASVLFSQFIPPSPSLTASISLFSMPLFVHRHFNPCFSLFSPNQCYLPMTKWTSLNCTFFNLVTLNILIYSIYSTIPRYILKYKCCSKYSVLCSSCFSLEQDTMFHLS